MDEMARLASPVQRLDARGKAVVTLAFIVAVMSFPRHEVSALTPFLLYPIALISLGRIPLWFIVKKTIVAAPFALAIAIFNPIIDRAPLASVGPLVVTGGWVSFASIMFRFVLTVGAALALVACTGMNRLGAAMEQLGIPRAFVVQLLFLYRYLFVISDHAGKMTRSAELRSGGRPLGFRLYGSMIGHLLLRSMARAERVHRAMVARGFDGRIRVLRQTRFQWRDALFICGCLALFAAARVWNLAAGLGQLLAGGAS
ncbi:MAG: cobalt ECF transporter T component CbiQ [Lentisphaeria bacterium]